MLLDFHKSNNLNKGQTSVEYILLIFVVISIMTIVVKQIRSRLLGTGVCNSSSKNIVCVIENKLNFNDISNSSLANKYRNFSF